MTGGFLRNPRVRVLWGETNLSSYDGGGGLPENHSVVYDVEVDLSKEGNGPTATMKWDPTGPGYALYEKFIEENISQQISIEFFYTRGKKITFFFVWSGHRINYGNNMEVTVKMQSELAGLINANPRSTAQAGEEEAGMSPTEMVEKAKEQFGLTSQEDFVQYSPATLKSFEKIKLLNGYGKDWTFGNNVAQIAKQTGDSLFANNIGGANLVFFAPYSWEGSEGSEEVIPATATSPSPPEPNLRYGYLLGPAIIDTITRDTDWKPPQQPNTKSPANQSLPVKPEAAATTTQTPPSKPQEEEANADGAAASTTAPLGTSNGASNLNFTNKENELGPAKQIALNQEGVSKLTLTAFMCPVLCGIKPNDIIFIPSLNGEYIEDWIVESTSYNQSNGSVSIGIQATRTYGSGTPMQESIAQQYLIQAIDNGLVGPNATLEAWESYAWGSPGSLPAVP